MHPDNEVTADLDIWHLTLSRSSSQVKIVGQSSRSQIFRRA